MHQGFGTRLFKLRQCQREQRQRRWQHRRQAASLCLLLQQVCLWRRPNMTRARSAKSQLADRSLGSCSASRWIAPVTGMRPLSWV